MEKPKVGDVFKNDYGDEVLIARVHEWSDYYDLEVINKTTDESGHMRIGKVNQ